MKYIWDENPKDQIKTEVYKITLLYSLFILFIFYSKNNVYKITIASNHHSQKACLNISQIGWINWFGVRLICISCSMIDKGSFPIFTNSQKVSYSKQVLRTKEPHNWSWVPVIFTSYIDLAYKLFFFLGGFRILLPPVKVLFRFIVYYLVFTINLSTKYTKVIKVIK